MALGKTMAFRFGVVGAAGRGGSFRGALQAIGAEVHAVCDLNEADLEKQSLIWEHEKHLQILNKC